MNRQRWSLALVFLLALPACRKAEAPVVETTAKTKSTNADGSNVTTTTDTKQVGSTLDAMTETNVPGRDGGKTESETVIGTVTEVVAGKTITVLTGDGKKHTYDLDDRKTTASIDRRVTVGTKVELDTTKDPSGRRSIRVVPVSSS